MVSLVIKNPDLPSGYEVISTSWYLASNREFTPDSIIKESIENTVNKFNIQWDDVELELGVKYYAKARVIYNKGFSNYSNINVFVAKDLNEIELDIFAPTKISRPTIKIVPNIKEKPISLLEFSGGDFITKYKIGQESATWILQDIDDKVIWSRINDSTNLNKIKLPIALKENSAYRLFLSYRGKNNNESQFAVETFTTGKNELELEGDLSSVPAGVDLTFKLNMNTANISSVIYELYAEGDNLVKSKTILATDGEDMTKWSIEGSLLVRDINYVLVAKSTDLNSVVKTGYFYFKPYFDLSETPDENFKYDYSVKNFLPAYTIESFGTSTGYRPELPNGEMIQAAADSNYNIILSFFKFDFDTKRFSFTGRSFNLGKIFGATSTPVGMEFSYRLMKNSTLVFKFQEEELLVMAPYNVISGNIDINLLKYRKLSNSSNNSKATNQHSIVDISDNEFVTFSNLDGRLIVVNTNDLSYHYLNSRVYDSNKRNIGIFKLNKNNIMILNTTSATIAKFDIFNIVTGDYIVQDETLNTSGIEVRDSDGNNNVKIVELFNGKILAFFKSDSFSSTTIKSIDLSSDTVFQAITNFMEIDSYIASGVYGVLRNGKVLLLSPTEGMMLE